MNDISATGRIPISAAPVAVPTIADSQIGVSRTLSGPNRSIIALKQALTTALVGFHAHNNLGLGIGNTLSALEAGADWVDGTLRGLGAGAGNTAMEVLAAVLDRMGMNPGVDVFKLMDAAEFVVAPMMPFQPVPDRDSIAIGYAGVYSTFLLHAKRLGEKYGVDPLEVLVELGRRKTMAGQEDMVLDVTLELARKKGRAIRADA